MLQRLLTDCPASHLLTRHEKKSNTAGAWHNLTKLCNRSGKASKQATQAEKSLKNAVCHDKHTKLFMSSVAENEFHWATLEEAKQPIIEKKNASPFSKSIST